MKPLSIVAGEVMTHIEETTHRNDTGYTAGHPWYYVRRGRVLKPREIALSVKARGYQGYMVDDILKADGKQEPQRSEALRSIKADVLKSFWGNLSRYRALATQLRRFRQTSDPEYEDKICADIHTNISLKHNHIYNDVAHLQLLEECLTRQKDLFLDS